MTGWTAGGGLEFGFDRNWSAKVGYLHYDLGSALHSTPFVSGLFGAAPHILNWNTKVEGDLVRAGINYRFNWSTNPVTLRS